jgi:hypothetical protein
MAFSTNVHTHSQTCRKRMRGRFVCRLSRPTGVHAGVTQPMLVRLQSSIHLGKRKHAEFVVESTSTVFSLSTHNKAAVKVYYTSIPMG